ncbi:MAG: hypothetical protein LBK82_00350 [Planctomycetaceae bacterium]|jgi:hypothetical protein|nr:hypothetical protein [Planctomycetaceae bacterium]
MSSNIIKYPFDYDPVIEILLENLHDPSKAPYRISALIDTGATSTVIPYTVCEILGHSFEKGIASYTASGIGTSGIRTFVHATRLTLLEPPQETEFFSFTKPVFEPIEFYLEFIEQDLPCVLLGQSDFLRLFRYTQDGKAGWFSLERI